MPLPLRQPALRRALVALMVVALVAVVSVIALRRHDSPEARAKDALAHLAPPGHGWVAASTGSGAGPDTGQRSIRHVVTWDREVGAGDEQVACSQAAAWLRRTGPKLPGHPDGRAEGVTNPSPTALVDRCTRALAGTRSGRTVNETFAMWQPGTRYAGYEFGASVTLHGDAAHRTLVVTAQAQQIQS